MRERHRKSVVWDYMTVYKPEQTWTDTPPDPVPRLVNYDGCRRARLPTVESVETIDYAQAEETPTFEADI
jgi:hypothetical protein